MKDAMKNRRPVREMLDVDGAIKYYAHHPSKFRETLHLAKTCKGHAEIVETAKKVDAEIGCYYKKRLEDPLDRVEVFIDMAYEWADQRSPITGLTA